MFHDADVGQLSLFPLALLAVVACTAPVASAHDDPDNELTRLSARIEREPHSAPLYLERAELYREERNWAAAVADLQTASTLDPAMAAVDLSLASLLFEAGNLSAALDAADRFVARSPENVNGHLVRARILRRFGSLGDAAAAYSRAIELDRRQRGGAGGIQPDDYLDRARALAESGDMDEAIRGLDEGLAALGGAVTLQLLAVELEQKRGSVDGALARLATMEAVARRKEMWIARRGDILAAAGHLDDAGRAYRAALEAISALPPRARDNAATAELEASVRMKLAATSPSDSHGDEP